MTGDKETLRVYGAEADRYAEMARDFVELPSLTNFIARLPTGGDVLDLGCGPGWAAARMAEEGLRVTATDATPEMVDMAARHRGVSAHLASFDDIEGEDIYDGIWANFSLLHAPRADLPRYLAALARALRPGGWFHIGMKTGKGEKRDTLGRLYTYVTIEELDRLLRDAALTPHETETGEDPGLDGTVAPWVTMVARA
ncbi:MAG: class I SAM-dependent methyltransferase [Pseudomonadota bacterium]